MIIVFLDTPEAVYVGMVNSASPMSLVFFLSLSLPLTAYLSPPDCLSLALSPWLFYSSDTPWLPSTILWLVHFTVVTGEKGTVLNRRSLNNALGVADQSLFDPVDLTVAKSNGNFLPPPMSFICISCACPPLYLDVA